MVFKKSHFSDSVINYRTPCTSSEGRLCNVFRDLSVWNEYFWQVGLQLREFSPGQLSLVEMRHAKVLPNTFHQKEAVMLLWHFLSHHHCIASVHLNEHVFRRQCHHQLICEALRKSPSLTKLKLCRLNMTENASRRFRAALSHLNQLQELEFSHVTLNRTSLEGLSEFLATTRSLMTLTMTDQCIEGEDAVVVLQGLRKNVTISTLSLQTSLLSPVSSRCGEIFAEYLRCNKTLRSLTVTSSSRLCFFDFRPIIGALSYNNILSELNLIDFSLDTLSHEIITEMLIRNRGLRWFHMINCNFNEQDLYMNTWVPVLRSGSSPTSLWLAALAENSTLEELTLELSWIKPEDCSSFFKALASNTSLKKINVPTFRQDDVAQISRALRETGVPERFFVGQHHVCRETAAALPKCEVLSRIAIYRCSHEEVEPLHTALRLLPTCSHVKSLCLEMTGPTFNGRVSSLLAQYLTETTGLRELRLELLYGGRRSVDRSERTLLQALSNNNSIRRLSLKDLHISEREAQMLVDMLQSSRTLCHLSIYLYNWDATIWLLLMLAPSISSNYMLLGMRTEWRRWLLDYWYSIKDVVRRNNSLVTRAAHFITGMRHKRDDGQKQLVDLNRDCWLQIRQYVKVGDILDSKFANRASALSLLRPATTLPTPCLAPMSAMSPKQAEATESFFEKNKSLKRPLSPHLSIYAPQMSWMLSLVHRTTGCAMAVGAYGMGVIPFMCSHNFPHYVEALQAMHISPILTFPVKLGLAFCLSYHTFNGMRHLAWDLGLGFGLKELYATGYLAIALSLVMAVVLAFK
ncbi:hypothetical protein HPB52_003997 [Rhipicephalus sanguineus]|uniref:Succinate dehydrogenase cytochrome b560 subunit, mitochondrial n=1 Tax=Rhipicephalus sanguineus TaxID=34632 RepID=A0A9D4SQN3_RHISA|nr:hypothetical protein HPB52_003997 [Rhipicephalus sanguineus]